MTGLLGDEFAVGIFFFSEFSAKKILQLAE